MQFKFRQLLYLTCHLQQKSDLQYQCKEDPITKDTSKNKVILLEQKQAISYVLPRLLVVVLSLCYLIMINTETVFPLLKMTLHTPHYLLAYQITSTFYLVEIQFGRKIKVNISLGNLSFSKCIILSDLFGQYQPLVIITKLW